MLSLEQEKQARTRKKQERTSKKQERVQKNTSNKPVTLYDAKRQVFDLIQQENNYRKISQVSFLIEGLGLKRFSISEIAKIKNELLGGSRNETKSGSSKEGKSEIFRLIKKGTTLEDIVILTNNDPEFVQKTYGEYMNLTNQSTLSEDDILDILNRKGIKTSSESLKPVVERLADAYRFLHALEFQCYYCKKPVSLSPYGNNKDWAQDMADAIHFLSQNNIHYECLR